MKANDGRGRGGSVLVVLRKRWDQVEIRMLDVGAAQKRKD